MDPSAVSGLYSLICGSISEKSNGSGRSNCIRVSLASIRRLTLAPVLFICRYSITVNMTARRQESEAAGAGSATALPNTLGGMFAHMLLKAFEQSSGGRNAKVYIDGRRVHHGEVGFAIAVVGNLLRERNVRDFGRALMDDDHEDAGEWFTFRTLKEDLRRPSGPSRAEPASSSSAAAGERQDDEPQSAYDP